MDESSTPRGADAPETRPNRSREVAALRSQLRSMQRLVVAMAVACAVAVSFAGYATFRKDLTVRRLALVDGDGVRARLGFEDGYPELVFFDREGTKRAQFDDAGLILWGDDGHTMLRELGDESRLEMKRSYQGKKTNTWLTNDGEKQQLLFRGESRDQVRLILDPPEGTRFLIHDRSEGTFVVPRGSTVDASGAEEKGRIDPTPRNDGGG